jgi:hypothetical protein
VWGVWGGPHPPTPPTPNPQSPIPKILYLSNNEIFNLKNLIIIKDETY